MQLKIEVMSKSGKAREWIMGYIPEVASAKKEQG